MKYQNQYENCSKGKKVKTFTQRCDAKSRRFSIFFFGVFISLSSPVYALDTTFQSSNKPSVFEAFQLGREALRSGDNDSASTALEYAARKGHILSRWKLGKMYAEGEGVAQDHKKAFQYFTAIADEYAEISPNARHAPIVADSFYQSGRYFINGIPEAGIEPQIYRGISMLTYASSYFRNDKAQFYLGRFYVEQLGDETPNIRKALRWLTLSCRNQNADAQIYLGKLLLTDPRFKRARKEGALWIEIAKSTLGENDPKIIEASAIAQANLSQKDLNAVAERAATLLK